MGNRQSSKPTTHQTPFNDVDFGKYDKERQLKLVEGYARLYSDNTDINNIKDIIILIFNCQRTGGSLYRFFTSQPPSPYLTEYCKDNLLKIATDEVYSLAIAIDENVYYWNRDDSNYKIPTLLTVKNPIQIAVGSHFAAILTQNGDVWTFGSNCFGQLGIGSDLSKSSLPQLVTLESNITQISCGSGHMVAISQDNKLFTWGNNDTNQCGVRRNKSQNKCIYKPITIDLNGIKPLYIDCGGHHNLLLCSENKVLSWGSNSQQQLGHNNVDRTPQIIESLSTEHIIDVAGGGRHSLCVSTNGNVFSFGSNGVGQCSQKIEYFVKNNIKIVSCFAGYEHSAVISENGELYVFGWDSQKKNDLVPIKVEFFNDKDITSISLGYHHTAIITMNR